MCMTYRNNIKKLSENGLQEIPSFSPDSRMVAFVRDNNIYVAKSLDYGTEVAVTKDGKRNEIINGVPDWVYQEEFGMLRLARVVARQFDSGISEMGRVGGQDV